MSPTAFTRWLATLSEASPFSPRWHLDVEPVLDTLTRRLAPRTVTFDDLARWSRSGAPRDVSDAIRGIDE